MIGFEEIPLVSFGLFYNSNMEMRTWWVVTCMVCLFLALEYFFMKESKTFKELLVWNFLGILLSGIAGIVLSLFVGIILAIIVMLILALAVSASMLPGLLRSHGKDVAMWSAALALFLIAKYVVWSAVQKAKKKKYSMKKKIRR